MERIPCEWNKKFETKLEEQDISLEKDRKCCEAAENGEYLDILGQAVEVVAPLQTYPKDAPFLESAIHNLQQKGLAQPSRRRSPTRFTTARQAHPGP